MVPVTDKIGLAEKPIVPSVEFPGARRPMSWSASRPSPAAMTTKPGVFAAVFGARRVYTGLAYYSAPPDLALRRTVQAVLAVERYLSTPEV